jgi:hypothetical protein
LEWLIFVLWVIAAEKFAFSQPVAVQVLAAVKVAVVGVEVVQVAAVDSVTLRMLVAERFAAGRAAIALKPAAGKYGAAREVVVEIGVEGPEAAKNASADSGYDARAVEDLVGVALLSEGYRVPDTVAWLGY